MKSIYPTLWLAAALLGILSACDDDKHTPGLSTEINGSYDAARTTITLDGAPVALKAGQAAVVTVVAGTDRAVVQLPPYLLPGEDALSVQTAVVPAGRHDYTLNGENRNADRVITLTGSIASDRLSLNLTRRITAPVVGRWKLRSLGSMPLPAFAELQTRQTTVRFGEGPSLTPAQFEESVSGLLSLAVAGRLGGLIFREDGTLTVTYSPDGGKTWNKTPADLVRYYAKGPAVYVLIDLAALLPAVRAVTPEEILALLQLLAATGLPVLYRVDGDKARIYVNRDMMLPFLDVVSAVLAKLPADPVLDRFVSLIPDLKEIAQNSEKLDIGLNFVSD